MAMEKNVVSRYRRLWRFRQRGCAATLRPAAVVAEWARITQIAGTRKVHRQPTGEKANNGGNGPRGPSPAASRNPRASLTASAAVRGSPDRKTLAGGSADQTVRLWDSETSQRKDTLKHAA
jgi:WD40 repeat protein